MKLSVVLLFALAAFAQDQSNAGAVFRSGVSLVRVDVEAIDAATALSLV